MHINDAREALKADSPSNTGTKNGERVWETKVVFQDMDVQGHGRNTSIKRIRVRG